MFLYAGINTICFDATTAPETRTCGNRTLGFPLMLLSNPLAVEWVRKFHCAHFFLFFLTSCLFVYFLGASEVWGVAMDGSIYRWNGTPF
jgi:hypothetical protein